MVVTKASMTGRKAAPAPAKAAPAKKATPAAASTRRAAPAKAAKAAPAKPVVEEPDLLADMADESSSGTEDDSDYDLLSDLQEENGTAWMPWDEEDQPDGVQGRVVYIGSIEADAKYGGGDKPYVELQDRTDPDLVWGIRGYATVLNNQLTREIDKGLAVGDTMAVKYFGEKDNRKGDNVYKNFRVVVKKG
jgi:hypothetical protein